MSLKPPIIRATGRRPDTLSMNRTATALRQSVSASLGHARTPSHTAYSTATAAKAKKRALDRDFFVSVLEASATKRDAKGYLQKYTSQLDKKKAAGLTPGTPAAQAPSSVPVTAVDSAATSLPDRTSELQTWTPSAEEPHIAIVQFRLPETLSDDVIRGVAKTLCQLRTLGLLSVVAVACGDGSSRSLTREQAYRISYAINDFGAIGSTVVEGILVTEPMAADQAGGSTSPSPFSSNGTRSVDQFNVLGLAIERGTIPIIPALSYSADLDRVATANAEDVVMALTKFFTGLQFRTDPNDHVDTATSRWAHPRPPKANVERIILLDPKGGLPLTKEGTSRHRYVNLQQEYDDIVGELSEEPGHLLNLKLVRDTLAILPSSASALITTPIAVAGDAVSETNLNAFGFPATVETRKVKNPLIHNLLTDKPLFSSSLPWERIGQRDAPDGSTTPFARMTTLVKRGMPVTIYPSTAKGPWTPPVPGAPRLRLTDACIDLPRLIHLIEDSFGRKLDARHYLSRLEDRLAGIIVAGEYEGGAILTWERPNGLTEEEAYRTGRLVPYLDKFAVLRSRQGSGGVADVVFNAMVQQCFPHGVCWRSRQNNPVNKWYFERSLGTARLEGNHWSMFWTTPELFPGEAMHLDYLDVCRGIEPSWAD